MTFSLWRRPRPLCLLCHRTCDCCCCPPACAVRSSCHEEERGPPRPRLFHSSNDPVDSGAWIVKWLLTHSSSPKQSRCSCGLLLREAMGAECPWSTIGCFDAVIVTTVFELSCPKPPAPQSLYFSRNRDRTRSRRARASPGNPRGRQRAVRILSYLLLLCTPYKST